MSTRPLLSDTQPTKYAYDAGDRLIARVSIDLTRDQRNKIVNAIQKRVGTELRILIVNCLKIRLTHLRGDGSEPEILASPRDFQLKSIDAGVANLDCSITKFNRGDSILVETPCLDGNLEKSRLLMTYRDWVGKDIEIKISVNKL